MSLRLEILFIYLFSYFFIYCMSIFYFSYRYERLLRRAKTEDLTEVSGIGCLYQSGVDRQGRPVVVFVGKWFPATKINLDKVMMKLHFSFLFFFLFYRSYHIRINPLIRNFYLFIYIFLWNFQTKNMTVVLINFNMKVTKILYIYICVCMYIIK